MHKLAQTVLGYILKNDLFRPGDRVGVAVSGGADSVTLLRLLVELRSQLGIVLSAVHLNHKLRGAESDADEQFVRELAVSHGLEFACESCDVHAHAKAKKLSLETAARKLRYEFFNSLLRASLDRIATAHTLDDQAETVLLKLARGAGTRGLAGIYPQLSIRPSALGTQRNTKAIVRPLLGKRRAELQAYLEEIGQTWREDASNRDLRHTRNRIRHGILPRLQAHVNPSVLEVLAETAETARAEEEYWTQEVARVLPQLWNRTQHGGSLNCRGLEQFPLALQRRLVRGAAATLGLGLEFRHVKELLDLQEERARATLPDNWAVSRHREELRFEQSSAAPADYHYALPVPGKIMVPEAKLHLEALVSGNSGAEQYNSEHLLDSKFGREALIVRNWHSGERFWPAHTSQPKKIKELLQDHHITGDEKRHWPVVASGDEIVWVRGLGVGKDFRATDGRGVLIRDFPISEDYS